MIQIVAHGIFFPANPMTIFIYKNESLNVDGITVKTINAFYVQHEEKPSCVLEFFSSQRDVIRCHKSTCKGQL